MSFLGIGGSKKKKQRRAAEEAARLEAERLAAEKKKKDEEQSLSSADIMFMVTNNGKLPPGVKINSDGTVRRNVDTTNAALPDGTANPDYVPKVPDETSPLKPEVSPTPASTPMPSAPVAASVATTDAPVADKVMPPLGSYQALQDDYAAAHQAFIAGGGTEEQWVNSPQFAAFTGDLQNQVRGMTDPNQLSNIQRIMTQQGGANPLYANVGNTINGLVNRRFSATRNDRALLGTAANDLSTKDQLSTAIQQLDGMRSSGDITDAEREAYFNKYIKPSQYGFQRNDAITGGRSNVISQLQRRLSEYGVDPNDYTGQIETDLNDIQTYIPAEGVDVNSIGTNYFGGSAASAILDNIQRRTRSSAQGNYRSAFGSLDENSLLPDTTDDDIINKIVEEQSSNVSRGIDMQQKRGALNDYGRSQAENALTNRRKSVESRLQTRGGQYLGGIRGQAAGIRDQSRQRADNASLSEKYDSANDLSRYHSTFDEGRKNLEGSLRDQISPDEFDTQSILGQGYSSQGPTNNTSPVLAALEARKKLRSTNRGLGTQGAF